MIRRAWSKLVRPLTWCIRVRVERLEQQIAEHEGLGTAGRDALTAGILKGIRGWELLRDVEDQPEPSPAYLLVRSRDEALSALLALDAGYAQRTGALACGEPPERRVEVPHADW